MPHKRKSKAKPKTSAATSGPDKSPVTPGPESVVNEATPGATVTRQPDPGAPDPSRPYACPLHGWSAHP
jgi:hypothetical protein